jgi:glycosyltransferase involved in cell wall biosynthesis
VKTLVIIDKHDSAIGRAAYARNKSQDFQILSASDYISPHQLFREIVRLQPDVLFFAWRGALISLLSRTKLPRRIVEKLAKTSIAMLIPDLAGLSPKGREIEAVLVRYVDYYLVTSKELFTLYSVNFPSKPPVGLYRDMPDVHTIKDLSNSQRDRTTSSVIWVGNSRWGIHQGFQDHKGLHELALPLRERLRDTHKFRIIDSAISFVPHQQVLQEIQSSEILIQTSNSEGTGLPLLEAAGLGTVPVTTNVGIASDFLIDDLKHLVAESNVDSFENAINSALENYQFFSKRLKERFEQYINEISSDELVVKCVAKPKEATRIQLLFSILDDIKWLRRWFYARKENFRFDPQ